MPNDLDELTAKIKLANEKFKAAKNEIGKVIVGQKDLIEKFSSQLIKISEADAINFACNSVNIDRFIILNKSSAKLIKTLLDRNFIVIETPLNEFLKAGGSAKCLTMEI